jgi:hypothetical protein
MCTRADACCQMRETWWWVVVVEGAFGGGAVALGSVVCDVIMTAVSPLGHRGPESLHALDLRRARTASASQPRCTPGLHHTHALTVHNKLTPAALACTPMLALDRLCVHNFALKPTHTLTIYKQDDDVRRASRADSAT